MKLQLLMVVLIIVKLISISKITLKKHLFMVFLLKLNFVLKENNYKLNLELFTNDLLITEEKIIINYTLNDEVIKFTLIKEVL